MHIKFKVIGIEVQIFDLEAKQKKNCLSWKIISFHFYKKKLADCVDRFGSSVN